jgi:hypothetical protein
MSSSNGTTSGVSDYEADLDQLYAWMPPQTLPQPCPEALFSLTLRGKIGGQEALLTARGQTAAEFKANVEAIKGLLDPPQPAATPVQASSQSESWCKVHNVAMKQTTKEGKSWYSHYDQGAGKWCKGK